MPKKGIRCPDCMEKKVQKRGEATIIRDCLLFPTITHRIFEMVKKDPTLKQNVVAISIRLGISKESVSSHMSRMRSNGATKI